MQACGGSAFDGELRGLKAYSLELEAAILIY